MTPGRPRSVIFVPGSCQLEMQVETWNREISKPLLLFQTTSNQAASPVMENTNDYPPQEGKASQVGAVALFPRT
jgi:hypothetical protein